MGWCARWVRRHAPAPGADRRDLRSSVCYSPPSGGLDFTSLCSTRYRFHAIPVAVSTLYHNRPHDYTAHRSLAMSFHDAGRDIDDQIREAIRPESSIGGGTYYWVADDRGLADFVVGAFWLFGPQVTSLSNFWFLLLSLSLACYAVGYWRTPSRTRRAACGHARLAGDRIGRAGSPPVPERSGILGRGDRALRVADVRCTRPR